jgi:predicted DNA-binding transcriptional regulator AlpA
MPQKRKTHPADSELAADLLEGGSAIAAFTGISEPRVFYLCERGHLPAFKIGIRWCALKSELRAALTSRTAKERIAQLVA